MDNAFVPGNTGDYYNAADAPFAVVLANPSQTLSAKFTVATNLGEQQLDRKGIPLDLSPIPPQGLRVLFLPSRNVDGTTLAPLAYRIDATAPLAAYQFNPLENVGVYSNDASLLLPEAGLGTDYLALSREQSFQMLRGFITVVATKAGPTTVTVKLGPRTKKTLAGTARAVVGAKLVESPIASFTANQQVAFELQQGDVLNMETDAIGADLTGTSVHADKPVAVFSGSEAANAPNTNRCDVSKCAYSSLAKGDKCGVCEFDAKTPCHNNEHCAQFITCCADHLELQLPPTSAWGHDHVAVGFKPREQERDVWRILAATAATQVQLDPPPKQGNGELVVVPLLDAGEWFEFETADAFQALSVHADGTPAPVLVGHFMPGQDAPGPGVQPGDAGTGDPAMSMAVARAQGAAHYVFAVPPKFSQGWVTVTGPTDAEVAIDGIVVPKGQWHAVNGQHKFARLYLEPGAHRADSLPVAGGQPRKVTVEVYGYDQFVSYAYPAGMGLAATTTPTGG